LANKIAVLRRETESWAGRGLYLTKRNFAQIDNIAAVVAPIAVAPAQRAVSVWRRGPSSIARDSLTSPLSEELIESGSTMIV